VIACEGERVRVWDGRTVGWSRGEGDWTRGKIVGEGFNASFFLFEELGVTNRNEERGLTVGFLLWGRGRVEALQSLRANELE